MNSAITAPELAIIRTRHRASLASIFEMYRYQGLLAGAFRALDL